MSGKRDTVPNYETTPATRERVIAGLVVLFAFGFLVDIQPSHPNLFSAFPYAVSVLIAAYFLRPRMVIGVALLSLVLETLASFARNMPFATTSEYILGIAAISFLASALSMKRAHEAKPAEEAGTSRKMIGNILESITDAFFALDREWRFTYVNEHAEPLLRHRRDELIGKNVWEVYPEAVGTTFYEEYHRAIKEQLTVQFEEYYEPFNTWFTVTAYPNQDGLSVYFQDITERKEGDIERERLLAEMDAAFTSIAEGIMIFDPEGMLVRINPAAENFLGFTFTGQIGLTELAHTLQFETANGEAFSKEDLPVWRALRGEIVQGVVVATHKLHGRKTIWLSLSTAPIRSASGKLLGAVAAFADITPLQLAHEHHEDFVRTISHDLRNPLTVILAQAQVIRRLGVKDESVLKCAGDVITSARRMESMIGNLVDSIRLEAGQFIVSKRPINLAPVVMDFLQRGRYSMAVERIAIRIPQDLPLVECDPDAFERILTNLVTNALKYSSGESKVRLSIGQLEANMIMCVIDRGLGIAPEDIPHIFERFYQPKVGRMPGGLGLGLYVTRMLVEANGGQIEVKSKVGKGTKFCVTLPLA